MYYLVSFRCKNKTMREAVVLRSGMNISLRCDAGAPQLSAELGCSRSCCTQPACLFSTLTFLPNRPWPWLSLWVPSGSQWKSVVRSVQNFGHDLALKLTELSHLTTPRLVHRHTFGEKAKNQRREPVWPSFLRTKKHVYSGSPCYDACPWMRLAKQFMSKWCRDFPSILAHLDNFYYMEVSITPDTPYQLKQNGIKNKGLGVNSFWGRKTKRAQREPETRATHKISDLQSWPMYVWKVQCRKLIQRRISCLTPTVALVLVTYNVSKYLDTVTFWNFGCELCIFCH